MPAILFRDRRLVGNAVLVHSGGEQRSRSARCRSHASSLSTPAIDSEFHVGIWRRDEYVEVAIARGGEECVKDLRYLTEWD
jgi:hypothetical protein